MPDKMSQADFVKALRKELPELADLPDHIIMSQALSRRPELHNRVEIPDDVAARAQARAEAKSKSIVDPEIWQRHPQIAEFSKQVLNSLPGIGSITGGLLASPETLGVGSIPGMAIGAGAGRGLRDIATSMLGLEPHKSLAERGFNIAADTSLAAIIPGTIEAARSPIQTSRDLTGELLRFAPRGIRKYTIPAAFEDFAVGGRKPNILAPSEFSNIEEPTEPTRIMSPELFNKWNPNNKGLTDIPRNIDLSLFPDKTVDTTPRNIDPGLFDKYSPTKFGKHTLRDIPREIDQSLFPNKQGSRYTPNKSNISAEELSTIKQTPDKPLKAQGSFKAPQFKNAKSRGMTDASRSAQQAQPAKFTTKQANQVNDLMNKYPDVDVKDLEDALRIVIKSKGN